MHLLVDISGHGLGHLAQVAPVVDALAEIAPRLRLTLRSAIPREALARRVGADFTHVHEARDFGFVMHNAVDIDLAASAARYREFHAGWPQRVAAEADWLRSQRVDAVLSNVAYLPLAAAAVAGIPAAGMSSLNWAATFAHYFGDEPWAAEIHAEILAAYNAATCFLRITPGLPMDDIPRRREIGPVASIVPRDRKRIAQTLGLDESERWLLLAMGGVEFRLPVERWPQTPGLVWLVPQAWQVQRRDMRAFDSAGLGFPELLASVDAVVTKPGYGTFAEAACGGIPILYLERDDWPETRYFAAWLAKNVRVAEIKRDRLLSGDFLGLLDDLWRRPAPPAPRPDGVGQAARWLATALGQA